MQLTPKYQVRFYINFPLLMDRHANLALQYTSLTNHHFGKIAGSLTLTEIVSIL